MKKDLEEMKTHSQKRKMSSHPMNHSIKAGGWFGSREWIAIAAFLE